MRHIRYINKDDVMQLILCVTNNIICGPDRYNLNFLELTNIHNTDDFELEL